jgi:DNA-directed RNA polymerase subunit alpha
MEHLPLPEKYQVKKISENQADIIIEPFYPGYGTTVGNALRRVLLSSLSGAAVTAFKIKGASHEFSTIKGIKEDLVEIILNLKGLRFKLHEVEETRVIIKVKGEKKVKAKDIKTTPEVEVVNPDADIATITDKDAELEMELIVRAGRGYVPVENIEKKKFELGTIAIDAIFSPVKNVNFEVESVRVGQMTNYDRLIMKILTDGAITPEDSLTVASQILEDHFKSLIGLQKPSLETPSQDQAEVTEAKKSESETPAEEKPVDEKPKKKRGRPKKEA